MNIKAIVAGTLLACAAGTASAQVYYERTYNYDPYRGAARSDWRDARDECWNPRAGHFEALRPGEVQDDLDFSRCRVVGERYAARPSWRGSMDECWNPRAGHFEEVRPGERQDDLDFSRCRRR